MVSPDLCWMGGVRGPAYPARVCRDCGQVGDWIWIPVLFRVRRAVAVYRCLGRWSVDGGDRGGLFRCGGCSETVDLVCLWNVLLAWQTHVPKHLVRGFDPCSKDARESHHPINTFLIWKEIHVLALETFAHVICLQTSSISHEGVFRHNKNRACAHRY